MKKHGLFKRGLSCCIAFVMMASILSLPMTVFAADPVSFTVTNVSGEIGTDVVVTISISANTNMGCVALNLQYDTTKLTYKSYTLGSAAMSSGPGNYMAQINTTYAVNGNLTTINDSYISDPGIMDGGAMINYKFTIKSGWTGSTPLTLTVKDLYTVDWVPLTSTVSNGSVSIPSPQYNVTFDANGGTGGTGPVLMQSGTPLTAPTVRWPGYAFAGWLPALPETVEGEATYTAQWVKTTVNVTQVDEDTLAVNIEGWAADYSYQIWTYQKITSDLLLNGVSAVQANQWIVSMPYTLGSAGIEELDGSLTFNIDTFISPNANYTVALRIADENGDYINEMRNAYTEETLLTAKITKVFVDGVYSRGSSREDIERNVKYTETKKITTAAETVIQVIGNVPGMTYTATVLETAQILAPSSGNEFVWDISSQQPRRYTVRVTASNGTTTDTRDIKFLLYETTTQYGIINSMNITGGTLPTVPQNIQITPSFANGYFYYAIQEAGRNPVIASGQFTAAGAIEQEITQFGIYRVLGYVNRLTIAPGQNTADDGYIQTVAIKRSQVLPSTVNISANVNLNNPVQKGTAIAFNAAADIGGIGATPVQYSYWRMDADGYLLIKDWSSDSTLNWTPGRVGQYTIQARAKGEDAGSYEAVSSVDVNVESPTEQIAQGVTITVNGPELNANAKSRTPIAVKVTATNTNGDDLLYKFNLAEPNTGARTVQAYSALQEYVWMPKKPGTYEISVLVKNQDSFGRYDAMEKITVEVLD